MSLPVETNVTIKSAALNPIAISLSTFGIPDEVWENAQIVLDTDPATVRTEDRELGKSLYFLPSSEITLSIKPVILYEDATFPVIICVEEESLG